MRFASVVATEFMKLPPFQGNLDDFRRLRVHGNYGGLLHVDDEDPGMARGLGLMGQKATFAFGGGATDWPAFLGFIVEIGSIGGLIIVSVVVSYVFGREYTEGMAKNLLALPIPRSWFVLGKLVVSAAWFALLTLWLVGLTFIAGSLLGLTGLTSAIFLAAAGKLMILALMAFCCAVLVAWIAVETRGYFAPLGFAIFTLVLANIFGRTGWGPCVPWTIVGLYSGVAGPETTLGAGSFAIIAMTFLIGLALTVRHKVYADNVQ